MATKKKASSVTGSRKKASKSKSESGNTEVVKSRIEEFDLKDKLIELSKDPTVRYVAAGLATAMLSRFANKINERYPEVSSFIKNNLDLVGNRFGLEDQAGPSRETHH